MERIKLFRVINGRPIDSGEYFEIGQPLDSGATKSALKGKMESSGRNVVLKKQRKVYTLLYN